MFRPIDLCVLASNEVKYKAKWPENQKEDIAGSEKAKEERVSTLLSLTQLYALIVEV